MKYFLAAFVIMLAGLGFALIWSIVFPLTHPVVVKPVPFDGEMFVHSNFDGWCLLTRGEHGPVVAKWRQVTIPPTADGKFGETRACLLEGHVF